MLKRLLLDDQFRFARFVGRVLFRLSQDAGRLGLGIALAQAIQVPDDDESCSR
jgi:hypothetical protein